MDWVYTREVAPKNFGGPNFAALGQAFRSSSSGEFRIFGPTAFATLADAGLGEGFLSPIGGFNFTMGATTLGTSGTLGGTGVLPLHHYLDPNELSALAIDVIEGPDDSTIFLLMKLYIGEDGSFGARRHLLALSKAGEILWMPRVMKRSQINRITPQRIGFFAIPF